MAKLYTWDVTEPAYDDIPEVEHKVTLLCSFLSGKAIVTIDGTEFDISVRPFGLRGTSQMFRLGEMAAMLDLPKKGAPAIIIDGERLVGKNA